MSEQKQTSEIQLFKPRPATAAGTNTEAAVARATQEVQAAMVIAKKFPRDETASFNRIMQACKRRSLAEVACYEYPRGGTTVVGPSVRLAECLAQNWGNVDFGIVELDQRDGESSVMAYCWDLETNTRQTKIFTVPHIRRVGKENKPLDDPRDIYEMVANQGARRLRACILGIIPGDVVEAAVNQCDKTLETGHGEPLIDRIRSMVGAFIEYGVTQAMIEDRFGHKAEVLSEHEMVVLRRIYTSLRDGAAKREDFFKPEISKPDFGEGKSETEEGKATTMPLPDAPQGSASNGAPSPDSSTPAESFESAQPKAEAAAVPANRQVQASTTATRRDSTAAAASPAAKKKVSLASLAAATAKKPEEPYNVYKAVKDLFAGEGILSAQIVGYLKALGAIEDSVRNLDEVPLEVMTMVEKQWRDIASRIKQAADGQLV